MPARTGTQVIQNLKNNPMEIWHRGQRVQDMTTEPGFAGGVASLAELYDLQWAEEALMLFDSPTTGDKVARTFMSPKTKEELASIGDAMQRSADHMMGMMGREPAYLNRAIAAYAGGRRFFESAGCALWSKYSAVS